MPDRRGINRGRDEFTPAPPRCELDLIPKILPFEKGKFFQCDNAAPQHAPEVLDASRS
jgi:hypothetical protein